MTRSTDDHTLRSRMMAAVRRSGTAPEEKVQLVLKNRKIKFRTNSKNLPGSPDIVIDQVKVVVFVHGCFWHRHGCKATTLPKTNVNFWKNKFRSNVLRDARVVRQLRKLGWSVMTIWGCQTSLKNIGRIENRLVRHIEMRVR